MCKRPSAGRQARLAAGADAGGSRLQAVGRLGFGWADSERGSCASALEVSPRISGEDTSEPTLGLSVVPRVPLPSA
jgi:hypothetical protein